MEKSPLSDQNIRDNKFLNALAEAFRLQEAILNTADIPMISISPEGMISSINRCAENLLGHKGEDLIGKNSPLVFFDLEEIISKGDNIINEEGKTLEPLFDVLTYKARVSGKTVRDTWTMVKKDGSRFPASVSISPLLDEQDSIMGYVAIPHDISEKIFAKQLSKSVDDKFKILAENVPGAIYLCHNDADYSVIYLNDHIEVITGYTANEFYTKEITFRKLFHPEDVQHVDEAISQAIKRRTQFNIRYRLRHKSGEWRWVEETGVGVFEGDSLTMLEGFLTDVTAQRNSEEELIQITEENHRVFNNPVSLNVVIDERGRFKRVSDSWTSLLGWSKEELMQTSFIEFLHPDDVESTLEAVQSLKGGQLVSQFENRYRCNDGSYRWLLWSCAPDHHLPIFYASAVDISDRKKSEDELLRSKTNIEAIALTLQEQNKALDEFAHIISHNLRSPIGNINALINLLDENSGIQDYKLIFYKLKNVAKNLSETMNDLMETLKVKTQTDLQRDRLRFKEILDKVIQSLEGDLIQAEASVTFDFNDAPAIEYPKAYLESIFQNLLSNSIKYRAADRKPKIHFSSQAVEKKGISYIELKITDNGQGIDLEKFGDKLFGLHKTFHTHEQARGVGLFLVKTQIESMGGSISADSEVDKGTTFTIRFRR
ncbi:MAG TPA: PAS domain S-box protein [Chryseosolibacter sp.]